MRSWRVDLTCLHLSSLSILENHRFILAIFLLAHRTWFHFLEGVLELRQEAVVRVDGADKSTPIKHDNLEALYKLGS